MLAVDVAGEGHSQLADLGLGRGSLGSRSHFPCSVGSRLGFPLAPVLAGVDLELQELGLGSSCSLTFICCCSRDGGWSF